MSSVTTAKITSALGILVIIVTAFIWINNLMNTSYSLLIDVTAVPMLIGAIILAVQLYNEKYKNKDVSEKKDEEQQVQRLLREKGEILQLVEKLSQEAKQQGSEEKRLAFEREAIELEKERLELEKNRVNYALEAMRQFADAFPANADQQMREATVNALLARLFPQSGIGGVEPILHNKLKEA